MKTVKVIELSELPADMVAAHKDAWIFDTLLLYIPWQLWDHEVENFDDLDHWFLANYPELKDQSFLIEIDVKL